eukprot:g1697.t1
MYQESKYEGKSPDQRKTNYESKEDDRIPNTSASLGYRSHQKKKKSPSNLVDQSRSPGGDALGKLKDFYRSSKGRVALGRQTVKTLVTPRYDDDENESFRSNSARSSASSFSKNSNTLPTLKRKTKHSRLDATEKSALSQQEEKENEREEKEESSATAVHTDSEDKEEALFQDSLAEVPHTARLEAYCPEDRISKNVLF